MVTIISGRSGSGKTERLYELMSMLPEGKKAVLIVPEQSSFENEKRLLRTFGEKRAGNIEVMSFRKLCRNVFDRFGGLEIKRIDDGVKAVLMSMAIASAPAEGGELEIFGASSGSARRQSDLIDPMLTAVNEYKMCMISPDMLFETARSVSDRVLRAKLRDSARIYAAYNALLGTAYADPDDDLVKLSDILEKNDYFSGMNTYIDSFTGFSAQELRVIRYIMRQSDSCFITLCTDDEPAGGKDTIFAESSSTYRELLEIANSCGGCKLERMKTVGIRYCSPVLKAVEAGVFSLYRNSVSYKEKNDGSVELFEAKDIYEEVSHVASVIYKLIQTSEVMCRDIEVIVRDTETYKGIISDIFPKYGIPYFISDSGSLFSKPLIRLILSAFEAVRSGFDTEYLLRYMKTGLTGLKNDEIYTLENYAAVWSIRGKRWRESFTMSPDGGRDQRLSDEELKEEIEEIEKSRSKLMNPLISFERNLRSASTGDVMTKAVYDLLEDINAAESFRKFIKEMSIRCGESQAQREAAIWDMTMTILQRMWETLRSAAVEIPVYYDLLRLYLSRTPVESIPSTVNSVTVGTAGSIRSANPYAVFVLGAVEGKFPAQVSSVGIFTDSERRFLREGREQQLCLPLYDSIYGNSLKEKYKAYTALSAARERLYVSWYKLSPDGEKCEASAIKHELLGVLPDTEIRKYEPVTDSKPDDKELFLTERQSFDICASLWNNNSPRSAALREYYLGCSKYSSRAEAMRLASSDEGFRLHDTSAAKKLYGSPLRLSSTKLECFSGCSFAYFMKYGLGVMRPGKAEMDSSLYGTAMHYIFEQVLSLDGVEALLKSDEEQIRKMISAYLEKFIGELGDSEERGNRFKAVCKKIQRNAFRVLLRMKHQFEKDKFRPVDFELYIGAEKEEDGLPSYKIDLPTGDSVEIVGKVDRVDMADVENRKYIRIIDYKTRDEVFKLSNIAVGIKIQMLLYLMAVLKNGAKRYADGNVLLPAGVLYVPSSTKYKDFNPSDGESAALSEQQKSLKMNGLLIDSLPVLSSMEEGLEGEFIPASCKKDGSLTAASSVVSEETFERIFTSVELRVKNMGQSLYFGEIDVLPTENACKYCDYRSSCRFEQGCPTKNVEKVSAKKAIEKIISYIGETEGSENDKA